MPVEMPILFITRHGDTAWTESRQRTGRTDIPLNQAGEERARQIGERLGRYSFAGVFTSLLRRASRTCELAGFGAVAQADPDLIEWDYGLFEGMLTKQVLKERPGWELFRDGCLGGESPEDVAARADRFIARVRSIDGDVLAFSSGHVIWMIAARWLGLPPGAGRVFYCRPASAGCSATSKRIGTSRSSASGTTSPSRTRESSGPRPARPDPPDRRQRGARSS
jgi:probable phosphoglycerate mutase